MLAVFPSAGRIDEGRPAHQDGAERRITYVAPYGIRYRYSPERGEVIVDSITDERTDSLVRFL